MLASMYCAPSLPLAFLLASSDCFRVVKNSSTCSGLMPFGLGHQINERVPVVDGSVPVGVVGERVIRDERYPARGLRVRIGYLTFDEGVAEED